MVPRHSPLSVGVGAILARWTVAAVAVVSGQTLLRVVDIATLRKVTAVILVALAVYTGWSALGWVIGRPAARPGHLVGAATRIGRRAA